MTPRPADILDCELLMRRGLDWKAAFGEIEEQSKGEHKWFFWTFEKVCNIENKTNLLVPIKEELLNLVKQHWDKRPSDFMGAVENKKDHIKDKKLLKQLMKQRN